MPPIIPQPIVELLQTGVSVVVGTRDGSLMPECTRAWGIRVEADHTSVTIFLAEIFAGLTVENLRENGMVAVSCARPTDHIACQLKGRVRTIRSADSQDRDASRRWHRQFQEELAAIGAPRELSGAWIVEPTVAIEIKVTEAFDQTPGPGAGRSVAR